jgi:hypothetical protein
LLLCLWTLCACNSQHRLHSAALSGKHQVAFEWRSGCFHNDLVPPRVARASQQLHYQAKTTICPFPTVLQALASSGVASRRTCIDLVKAGKVQVNGSVITDPATKVRRPHCGSADGCEQLLGYFGLNVGSTDRERCRSREGGVMTGPAPKVCAAFSCCWLPPSCYQLMALTSQHQQHRIASHRCPILSSSSSSSSTKDGQLLHLQQLGLQG